MAKPRPTGSAVRRTASKASASKAAASKAPASKATAAKRAAATKRPRPKREGTTRATTGGRYGVLTVGQTAKILGVSPSTLRLWESEGLVAPMRTSGRYRLYSPELLKVLKRIKYLREVQRLNVPGIRRELGAKGTKNGPVSQTILHGDAAHVLRANGRGGSAAGGDAGGAGVGPGNGDGSGSGASAGAHAGSAGRARAGAAAGADPFTRGSSDATSGGAARHKPERPLGPQLRRLRERKGLGLVEAARRSGVSPGFLSAVEHGQANASVATLQRLAMCYGTTVMDLFQRAPHEGRLVRPGERRVLTVDPGVRMEMLSTGAPMLQSMLFRVAPLAGSEGAYTHQGEEFIYMLSGVLEMWLDELECFVLREGDSFWFPSTQAHRWFNPGDTDAVLVWINTPPTF